MYERRSFEAWNHTARILQTIANANRDPEQVPDPYPLEEFHPLMNPAAAVDDVVSFSEAKDILRAHGVK